MGNISAVQAAGRLALQHPLTDEQAEAIATDEDVTLVLAGAGTGKTTVIVGKVAHLVRNQGVSPHEILVVAFNRKAAAEIRERLPGELSAVDVSTFHAFGRRVIAESGGAPNISELAEDEFVFKKAVDGILNDLLDGQQESDAVTKFITYHHVPYRSAFDFDTRAEYDEYVRGVELRILSGFLVKSFEELVIANYLTEHDIKFRYEDRYKAQTATQRRRQYQPDFFLPDNDIYIEHFALDERGRPPPNWKGYAEGVEWKRSIHRQYGTKLIETYSWQHRKGILLPTLRKQLEEAGVRFERVSLQGLIWKLAKQLISWLVALLMKFLNHFKTSKLTLDTLRTRAREFGDSQRNEVLLDIFEQVYVHYEQMLADRDELDFHDLINLAERRIREGSWKTQYRYVLVDEFQDVSVGRMVLIQALRRQNMAYFLVGDDWQSIYRFAGSDVSLLRNCGDYLGYVQEQTLTRTFRFRDGILDPSTAFVQRNPEQTRRPLQSASGAEDEGITIIADQCPEEGLKLALQDIETRTRGTGERHSVLILGRYQSGHCQAAACRRGKRHSVLVPGRNGNYYLNSVRTNRWRKSLSVETSTVHRAKGREADYVVVLDLKDVRMGFPSRIEDDPLLELVLPPISGAAYPFAEERRLFYVAMTRAQSGVYLVTDPGQPSKFVVELLRESGDLRQLGELAPGCPRCPNGRLVLSQSRKNLRCSNYPNCEYLAPRCPNCNSGYAVVTKQLSTCTNPACDHSPTVCPSCGMGVLLVRNGPFGSFWGCTEYWSEPSCRYKRNIESETVAMRA